MSVKLIEGTYNGRPVLQVDGYGYLAIPLGINIVDRKSHFLIEIHYSDHKYRSAGKDWESVGRELLRAIDEVNSMFGIWLADFEIENVDGDAVTLDEEDSRVHYWKVEFTKNFRYRYERITGRKISPVLRSGFPAKDNGGSRRSLDKSMAKYLRAVGSVKRAVGKDIDDFPWFKESLKLDWGHQRGPVYSTNVLSRVTLPDYTGLYEIEGVGFVRVPDQLRIKRGYGTAIQFFFRGKSSRILFNTGPYPDIAKLQEGIDTALQSVVVDGYVPAFNIRDTHLPQSIDIRTLKHRMVARFTVSTDIRRFLRVRIPRMVQVGERAVTNDPVEKEAFYQEALSKAQALSRKFLDKCFIPVEVFKVVKTRKEVVTYVATDLGDIHG